MSGAGSTRTVAGRTRAGRAARRGSPWRWLRPAVALAAIAGVAVGVALTAKVTPEHQLPLEDQAIIRTQASEKHLDPALIAAVIYAETRFLPRESTAGAQGLMQIMPSTADFLAKRSGGITFTTKDLANPRINIAYGSYYLRYLLNHYNGNKLLAIAAYNAGLTNVDSWVEKAEADGRELTLSDIPYSETRAYVEKVLSSERTYRKIYPHQLGVR